MHEKHGPAVDAGAGGSPAPEKTEDGGPVGGHMDSEAVVIDTGDDKASGNGDEAEQEKAKEEGGASDYLKLWSYAEPADRVLHAVGFASAIGAGAALPLMTLVFGELINIFNDWGRVGADGEPLRSVADLRRAIDSSALWFVYLFVGKFVFVYLHTTCFTIAATRMTRGLRLAYVRSILRQEIAYFDTCTPGSVATRISTNANLIQTGLGEKVGIATQGFSMLVSAFVVAFSQNWKLTLVTATTLPAVILLVGVTVFFDQRLEARILEVYSKAGGLAEEALSSVRNVVAFGAHDKLVRKYNAYLDAAKAFGVKKGPYLGLQYSSEFSVMYCAYSLSFYYGIQLLLRGEIPDGGTIFTIFFSCIIATSSMTIIAPSVGDFTKAAAASRDVLRMIAREPAIDSASNEGLRPQTVRGHIELRGVDFRYPARPTVTVLEDLNMVFEAGKTTALVGASGSGKSTIVALAERWYDPDAGEVLVDGHNVKDLNLRWLRSQIGLVQQEPMLFNDTVFANVAHGLYGTEMASLPEDEKRRLVKAACVEANADAFIETLPEGYDTVVGERASLMSGGQKQRIAIARSIVGNPRILLLDEATSALDPRAEGIVQAALDRAAKSRTTIVVAHRLSTVKKADKIIVMNRGAIIEQGTHESLLAEQGAYYRLVSAQKLSVAAQAEADHADDDSSSINSDERLADVDRVETRHSTWSVKSELKHEDVSTRFGLMKCIWIIFFQHKYLWAWFLAGVTGCVMAGAVFPVQAVLFSRIATVFSLTGSALEERGNFWALMFFFLALGTLVAYATTGFVWTTVAFIMVRVHRCEYFTAMITQDIAFFDIPENSSGSLTGRLSADPQALHDLIQGNLGLIIVVIVNLLSSCTLSLAIGWKLALVAIFGALPLLFAAGFTRMRLELTSQERVSKFFLESTRFASEAVGAIRTVQSLTLEDGVMERYAARLNEPVRSAYRRTAWLMLLFGLSESVDLLGMGLAFWYGGRLLISGEYSARQFYVVFIAVVFGGQAAGFLFGFTTNLTKAHAAANNIIHLRDARPAINGSTGAGMPPPPAMGAPAIEFRDVRFAYPTRPSAAVLRHCNLSIMRGQRIGLVGASGCGKTTIIALLERFYDITSGEILINGAPLSSLDVHQYRSTLALVAQEPTLYQGSIRDNITLGTPSDDVSDAMVEAAAKSANIHTFIMSLPQGYATDVGTKGVALSGGQRQRLAIARALIRDPSVLLLDEATSALDTQSERVVQDAIDAASEGRTTIAVAHRLSTIRHYDRIFVFDGGRVVEDGTHEELVERKGRYWSMCQGQSLDREAT